MRLLVFINYIMLLFICEHMGIIVSDVLPNFLALGVIALIISIVLSWEAE